MKSKMPKRMHNVACLLQMRERGAKVRFPVDLKLQEYAEDKAVVSEMQEIYCKLPTSARSTFLTSFSPDSTKVASTHGDHKIYVCDVRTGKLLHKLEGHPRTPWCLAFHPTSNDILASGCLGGEVRVWHLHGGSEKWRANYNTVITSLAFHPLDKVLVIATFNEIHFWDWSLSQPFASCSTTSISEKVRFVKFDRLGNKLITGISNLPDGSSAGTSCCGTTRLSNRPPRYQTRSESNLIPSTISQNRSLVHRLFSMYQQSNPAEENRYRDSVSPQPLPSREEVLSQTRFYTQMTVHVAHNTWTDLPVPIRPSANSGNTHPSLLTVDDGPTVEQRELLDSHEDFLVQAFWRTFNRLRSICTTLERRMLQLQHNAEQLVSLQNPQPSSSNAGSSEPSRSEAPNSNEDDGPSSQMLRSMQSSSNSSNYLVNVLTRLQNSLQFSSLASSVVEEHIQRLTFRSNEILERLTNITGYRARLQTLRDQILDVAERTERRRSEANAIRRLDLAHCLWLVEMSLQLTQQMQRILNANYRLTQLHIHTSTSRVRTSLSDNNNNSNFSYNHSPFVSLHRVSIPPTSTTSTASTSNSTTTTADTGSSEEFDQAWDRLRVVIRRELELLTQRFRASSSLNIFDPNLSYAMTGPSSSSNSSSSSSSSASPTTSLNNQPLADPLPHPSAAWNPVLIPLAEHPTLQRLMNSPNGGQELFAEEEDEDQGEGGGGDGEDNESQEPRTTSQRLLSVFNHYQSWHRTNRQANEARNSSASSSRPSSSSSNHYVPEIFVVPSSASGHGEDPVVLAVNDRPRSPPLSAILSGNSDPIVSSVVQAMYDAGTFSRFAMDGTPNMHRIQAWDFSKYEIPKLTNSKANVIVTKCRIHNDASIDISKDGEMLVALVPSSSPSSMNSDSLFAIYSLKQENLGQLLYKSDFDCNAISVSFSPLSQYIVIGMATPRLYLATAEKQAVAQIFELKHDGEKYVSSHIRSLTQEGTTGAMHPTVSLNSVQWLPQPGQGLIYGTNRGCLCICKPIAPMNGKVIKIVKNNNRSFSIGPSFSLGIHDRNFGVFVPHRVFSASTQTAEPETQTTGTQTFGGGDNGSHTVG